MYACNAGSTEFLFKGELMPNLGPLAMKMSKSKLFKNNFIDGSDDYGYQIYNYHCSKEEKFKIINQLLLTILNNESLSI